MPKETIYTQRNDSVFVQFEPGKQAYYLGDCTNLDSVPNPRIGDLTLIQCWNRAHTGFDTKGVKYSPPGAITFTLSQLLEKTATALQLVACPYWIYILRSKCGGAGLIRNWDSGAIVGGDFGCVTLDDTLTNVANRTEDNENGIDFSIAAPPPRIDFWKMGNGRQTNPLIRALNAVSAYKTGQCGGDCGAQILPCDIAMAVEDAGAATAVAIQTLNEGITWTASAASPHAITEDLFVCGYVPTPSGGRRYFAGREQIAGTALELSYSDDNGATWTTVVIGATLNEGFTLDKSLFIMDYEHIWCCTTAGEVYFSNDGGASFASQAATGASGANALNSIHFCDEDFGVAVGAADTVIYTEDGGTNWRALAATGKGVALQCVYVFNHQRWIIGAAIVATGSLVMTYDQGTTYPTMTFTNMATEEVKSLDFANQFIGLIVTDTAGPVGSVHYTKDGGFTWEELTVPTNAGLNSVSLCNANTGFVVGEVQGATPMILHFGQ